MKYRVLIVEDDEDALHEIAEICTDEGYQVYTALNGTDALQKALNTFPHIILVDLWLPDIDGFEVIRQLKKHPQIRDSSIISMTSHQDPVGEVNSLNLGANDYISKPIRENVLKARMKKLLHIPKRSTKWVDSSLANSGQHKVFISYSHEDSDWLKRLQVHLKPLEREGLIDRWDDTRISVGQKWRTEIRTALNAARVAVLLISADFLASDFITNNELPPLLRAAEYEGTVILPIILSPSRFRQIPELSEFQTLNDPNKPLVLLSKGEQEEAWVHLASSIEKILRA